MERPPIPVSRGLEARKEHLLELLNTALLQYGEIASMVTTVRNAQLRENAKPPVQVDYAYLSALSARESALSDIADNIDATLERVTEMTKQIESQRRDLADFLEYATSQDRSEPTKTN